MVLEKPLESPLDCKEIQRVHPKGTQPWIFIGRTDAEVEALILWPPDAKRQLTGKDSDAGKDWRQKEKRVEEDEMVGSHHQLNWHHWANSGRQWRTDEPGMLQSRGLQRVGQNLGTEQQQKYINMYPLLVPFLCVPCNKGAREFLLWQGRREGQILGDYYKKELMKSRKSKMLYKKENVAMVFYLAPQWLIFHLIIISKLWGLPWLSSG